MSFRKTPLVDNEIYHIFTRSIAEYTIFRTDNDYRRLIDTLYFYLAEKPPHKFSTYMKLLDKSKRCTMDEIERSTKLVQLLAYCIMPTHIHLVLKQLKSGGISKYVNRVLKSYGKYFNVKYRRKGPLCEGRFKNVLVEDDQQLLHLTRYVHLNPSSASLVKDPREWVYSSYHEFLGTLPEEDRICQFEGYFDTMQDNYQEFVSDRIDYQRELQRIKHLLLE